MNLNSKYINLFSKTIFEKLKIIFILNKTIHRKLDTLMKNNFSIMRICFIFLKRLPLIFNCLKNFINR